MNKEKINELFFNKWSKSYDRAIFQFWMRGFQRQALKELRLRKDAKILDVSCGTGQLLNKLNGKAELYGVDISSGMLEIANKRLGNSVVLKKAEVHNLPFPDNYFDYVITTEAFHHYHGQINALLEMKRVVKPGGEVIVSDVNFLIKPINYLFEKFEPGCVKINSRKEMLNLFQKSGWKVIKQKRNFLFAIMTVGVKADYSK